MSRICVMNPGLQPVETSSSPWAPESNSGIIVWNDSPTRTPWWSVLEYRRTLQCSSASDLSESDGFLSLNSPFGSSMVH